MQGLENLDLNMQISEMPIAIWCTNSAHEVYSELQQRTNIRNKAKELMEKKFLHLQGQLGARDQYFEECEYQQRRIEYWNYIRKTIQLISFQNRVMKSILVFKEK